MQDNNGISINLVGLLNKEIVDDEKTQHRAGRIPDDPLYYRRLEHTVIDDEQENQPHAHKRTIDKQI
jgi:hypothetical protein